MINTVQAKEKLPLVEKNTFSYFIGSDGKKRWYRTGQSKAKRFYDDKSMGIFGFIPGGDKDDDFWRFGDFTTFFGKLPNRSNNKPRQR